MTNPPPLDGPDDRPLEIVHIRRPAASEVFSRRADRFRALSEGHVLGDFLRALAHLADAQLRATAGTPAPSVAGTLETIVGGMQRVPLPAESRTALAWLASRPAGDREAIAVMLQPERGSEVSFVAESTKKMRDRFSGFPGPRAAVVFVAAALQAFWTARASDGSGEAEPTAPGLCPTCGSPPVAAVVLGDQRLRYLACALCATEWYLPRLTCATCGSTEALTYFGIDSLGDAVKAEACGACRTYLKVLSLEHVPLAEPVADDVATMALDLLVGEEGYSRAGRNVLVALGVEAM